MPRDVIPGPNPSQLEEMAALLEASGQYRVLRRVSDHEPLDVPSGTRTRTGILCDTFVQKPWACSLQGADWAAEGFEGSRLGYLAMKHGLFFDGYRAVHNCEATLQILARPLLRSGVTGMARLLENARRPSWRIWAVEAPFHHKDTLKARGYRWNGEANGHPKAWYIDVAEEAKAAECTYLCESIYGRQVEPLMRRFTTYERSSIRG